MKKSFICIISLLLATISLPALSEPTELNASQLDWITAGQDRPPPNGGAIVGNNSTAVLASTGEVTISDGAQATSRALNFVNSSESTVANGVNVFDGRVTQGADLADIQFDIQQQNSVNQDQRRLASLPSYDRGANTHNFQEESGSSMSSSSKKVHDEVTDIQSMLVLDESTTKGGFDKGSAPTLKAALQLGQFLNYEVEANAPSASNSVGVVFNGEVDYVIPPATAEIVIGGADGVTITLVSPSLEFGLDATGCVAVNGSCTIDGSRTEKTEDIIDKSTLYTLDESQESFSDWASSSTESVQAAFELKDAQAEYIVVDESEIDVSASYLVSLSGGAQSSLRAMNIVNAAGSAVANGVNVATQRSGSLTSGGPRYNLTQLNEINHSR